MNMPLGCESFNHVLKTLAEAKSYLGEILSAYEFIDLPAMKAVSENLRLNSPLADYPFYVLIETSGSNSAHDEDKLNSFLKNIMDNGTILDGTIATELSKIKVITCKYHVTI